MTTGAGRETTEAEMKAKRAEGRKTTEAATGAMAW
jgi:hypothetical protein